MYTILSFAGYAVLIYLWIGIIRKLVQRNGASIGTAVSNHIVAIGITVFLTYMGLPNTVFFAVVIVALCVSGYFAIKRWRLLRNERRQAQAIQDAVNRRDAHYRNIRVPTSIYSKDTRILG